MFGEYESDSEGQRVGSPWDSLLSSSPSPDTETKRKLQRTTRLLPEVEEGNVEYKLKLVDPTPERFARLVTQLKWRLLEGNGQAYYELGVADSGQLVGLTRTDLERTLETLEGMAGEIGASVIIVKEIEVPALRTVKEGLLGVPVGGGVDFSQVDGAMRLPRRRHLLLPPSDDSEEDTETPETDPTTDDVLTADEQFVNWNIAVHGDTVRPEWTLRTQPEDEEELEAFDIEVSAVYKPLPSLRRAQTEPAPIPSRRKCKPGTEKALRNVPVPRPKTRQQEMDAQARALERKARRDARRAERQRIADEQTNTVFNMHNITEALPVPLEIQAEDEDVFPDINSTSKPSKQQQWYNVKDGNSADDADRGPRLIVEALIVRKAANTDVFINLDDFSIDAFL